MLQFKPSMKTSLLLEFLQLVVQLWKQSTKCKENFKKNRNIFNYFLDYSLVGPINPRKPAEGVCYQVWLLKRMGLLPPETDSKIVKILYEIWSVFYRGLFMYIFTTTQMMYFLDVKDLTVSFKALFHQLFITLTHTGRCRRTFLPVIADVSHLQN